MQVYDNKRFFKYLYAYENSKSWIMIILLHFRNGSGELKVAVQVYVT